MIIEKSLTSDYKEKLEKKSKKVSVFSSKGGPKVTVSQQGRQSGRKLDTRKIYNKLEYLKTSRTHKGKLQTIFLSPYVTPIMQMAYR